VESFLSGNILVLKRHFELVYRSSQTAELRIKVKEFLQELRGGSSGGHIGANNATFVQQAQEPEL
jgi:hypothetical protein